MKTRLLFDDFTKIKSDAVVIFTFEDKDTEEFKKVKKTYPGQVRDLKDSGEFKGKEKTMAIVRASEKPYKRIALGGLGKKKEFSFWTFMTMNALMVATLQEKGFKDITISVPVIPKIKEDYLLKIATESAIIGSYKFAKYKTEEVKEINFLKSITLLAKKNSKDVIKAYEEAVKISNNVNYVKDLQNTPPNELYPKTFADEAKKVAKKYKLKINAWGRTELKKRGFNAILAVGKGSSHEPYLVTMEYKARGAKKTICLVGKGLTYDSGGINIKPWKRMDEMKCDMSGAGAVLGVMKTIAELKPKVNVIGVLGMAENMPGGNAYKPGDIIRTKSGKTIEVLHTDAEGRVVLADALYHATTLKPDYIIDIATLTGACVVCLGTVAAGIMGSDDKLIEMLAKSAEKTGERLWQLPMWPEYQEDMKSNIADIKNIGVNGEAGTITAAFFLKTFVGKSKWAHLDIAGVDYATRENMFMASSGGTGYGVRLLTDFIMNLK